MRISTVADVRLGVATLTELLQDAEKHHGEYEPTASKHKWSANFDAGRFRRRALWNSIECRIEMHLESTQEQDVNIELRGP